MQTQRIRRVPVVRDGEIVGVISRRELLRYLTEDEEAVREFLDAGESAAAT
jgi:CBS domain-containing protein